MYALCSDAMLKAITRQARAVDDKVKAHNATHKQISIAYFFDHLATEEDTAVMVTEQDFIEANGELVPSVSADELGHYERVRKAFEGTGKKEEHQKQQSQLSIENGTDPVLQFQMQSSGTGNNNGPGKGKGKSGVSHGKAHGQVDGSASDSDDYVIRTEHLDIDSSVNGAANIASGAEKGKGKASASHGKGKSSVDIAEGGFGDGAQDEDLYE